MGVVFDNPYVEINAVAENLSARSLSWEMSREMLEKIPFGNTIKGNVAGLIDLSCTIGFYQNFADDNIDEKFFNLWNNKTEFALKIREDTGVVGAANPMYHVTKMLLENHSPFQGSAGELMIIECNFKPGDNATLTREVA